MLHLTAKICKWMLVPENNTARTWKHLIGHFHLIYLTYWANCNQLVRIFRRIIGKFLFVLVDQPKNITLAGNIGGFFFCFFFVLSALTTDMTLRSTLGTRCPRAIDSLPIPLWANPLSKPSKRVMISKWLMCNCA